MSEAPASPLPVADRTDFFDEQRRRRRSARILSLVCLLIVSGIGIVLSSAVTPLLLLVSGGLLHLLARLGIVPTLLRHVAHGLGAWANGHSAHFQELIASLDHVNKLGDLGVTIPPLLRLAPISIPALMATCLVWIVLHWVSLHGASGPLAARLHARAADTNDREERQLANIVAEMAVAAGLPAPSLLIIDSPEINAAAVGGAHGPASVLVTRGLLDQLDRDETAGIVAHLVASIGAGDIRLLHGTLAVFQTLGFFITCLDLPFRWSAWQALGGLAGVVTGLQGAPEKVDKTLEALERAMDAETMPDVEKVWSVIPYRRLRLVLLAPVLPFMLISMILRLVLFLWTSLFLGPPLAMIWRNRRYAADAMAVQLTRNPDGLARALSRIGGSSLPEGGEGREYSFVHAPLQRVKLGTTPQRTMTGTLHPVLGRRLQRLQAMGSTAGSRRPRHLVRFDMIAQHPGKALLVGFLLLLLVPLGGALIVMIGYLTAIAMTLALAAGLAVAAGLLG